MGLADMTINELRIRRTMADAIIRELLATDDPRAPGAIAHYTAQLQELDAELTKKEREERRARGVPEPEPIIVGVKAARLFGQTK